MNKETVYTSTGDKLYAWSDRLVEFKNIGTTLPISTHISPEGSCNLKCSYCSVTKRNQHSRLSLDTIKQYIKDINIKNSLKAVILTGGGEPTLYPQFDELLEFLYSINLKVGLITNGTNLIKHSTELLNKLTWMRVSYNAGANIVIPKLYDSVVLGLSYIVSNTNKIEFETNIKAIISLYNNISYVRVLPNCLEYDKDFDILHEFINDNIPKDDIFFHQHKGHTNPSPYFSSCPMGYFRPYLSEQLNNKGVPGTIYPCDSVVLNDSIEKFDLRYSICDVDDISKYLSGEIKCKVCPSKDCQHCVFAKNLNTIEKFHKDYNHVEFI
jgi:MoaA/NifB/PqqE/SkfB family radical SAM enzyme